MVTAASEVREDLSPAKAEHPEQLGRTGIDQESFRQHPSALSI
jgi:hypothetical protein